MSEQINITARDLGEAGEGIGALETGMTCFIPDLLPGESAEATVVFKKATYQVLKIQKRLADSPERVKPTCPHVPLCGGCQLQHLSAEGQLKFKRSTTLEALKRIAGLDWQGPGSVLASPKSKGYRNKAALPVKGNSKNPIVGFFQNGTHKPIQLDHCEVMGMPHSELLTEMRSWITQFKIPLFVEEKNEGLLKHILIKSNQAQTELMLVLVAKKRDPLLMTIVSLLFEQKIGIGKYGLTSLYLNFQNKPGNAILGPDNLLIAGKPWITETLAGLQFRIGPDSFFQLNPEQAENLYRLAISHIPQDAKTILDLYCGTGTLTLLAAKQFPKAQVTGVEFVKNAIHNARENAEENKLSETIKFHQDDSATRYLQLISEGKVQDAILVNPPRAGLSTELRQALLSQPTQVLIYISCKPSTLARDLKELTTIYELSHLHTVDMLPQTTHVENIAVLKLKLVPPIKE